jgi:nucleotide-binding universal stress UspA family protein
MYEHILLATDGSALSREAARRGVACARSLGARVTALHVTPVFRPSEMHAHAILREVHEEEVRSRAAAHRVLDVVMRIAHHEGVKCESMHRVSDRPWEAIVQAADEEGCDLISMGTHGWSGVRALVLGSTTNKVLAHARVPVLVWPPPQGKK